jgi:Mrp family chromosome partitioning ATPase
MLLGIFTLEFDAVHGVTQDLIFVLGKGGTGRTTTAAALGLHFASAGERVLVVQWALRDSLSQLYGLRDATHETRNLAPHLSAMNFSFEKALEEYFVSHLKMRTVFDLVIRNSQVQKLVRAAPGIQELFFLGRLFWLLELAEAERGWRYDRIIVDAPASGHGAPLFRLPRTVSSFGLAGPIAYESERVARLLEDPDRVGVILVATPEELPVQELLELNDVLKVSLGRGPLLGVVNRCVDPAFFGGVGQRGDPDWWVSALRALENNSNISRLKEIRVALNRRCEYEDKVVSELEGQGIKTIRIPDAHFIEQNIDSKGVIQASSHAFEKFFAKELL